MQTIGYAADGDEYIVKLTRFEMGVLNEVIESRSLGNEEAELMRWINDFRSDLSKLSLPKGMDNSLSRSLIGQTGKYRRDGRLLEFSEWAELVRTQPYKESPLFGIRNFGVQGYKLLLEALASKP